MSVKLDKLEKCPTCGAHAVMSEVTHTKYGKTRYHAICSRKTCVLHRIPEFADCLSSQSAASAAWNGGV